MAPRTITPQVHRQIVQLLAQGKSKIQVAKELVAVCANGDCGKENGHL